MFASGEEVAAIPRDARGAVILPSSMEWRWRVVLLECSLPSALEAVAESNGSGLSLHSASNDARLL